MAQGPGVLEEIIVTATKREQNLQDVPISVVAFTGDSLEDAGILDTTTIGEVVPGLTYQPNHAGLRVYMRGVGSGIVSAGGENSIATYVDNVYDSTLNGPLMQLHNIDRVEVIKGPQGTLFGRNATGGVIHVHTLDPAHETSGKIQLGFDNYETISGRLYLTGELTSNLAADVSAMVSDQGEGWGKNLVTGNEINKMDSIAARSKWLWEPTGSDEVRLIMDFSRIDGSHLNSTNTIEGTFSQFGPGTQTAATRADLAGLVAARALPPTTVVGVTNGRVGDFYDTNSVKDPEHDFYAGGVSLQWDHEFSSLNFKSITAYRRNQMETSWAPISTGSGYHQTAGWINAADQFSQEIQFSSSADSKLQWVAGLYYLDAKVGYDHFYIRGTLAEITSPFCAPPPFGPGNCAFHDETVFVAHQSTESVAAFGEATYPILDTTNLTFGVRYTHEERGLATPPEGGLQFFIEDFAVGQTPADACVECGQGNYVFGIFNSNDLKKTFAKTQFRASIDHHFNDDFMGFFSFSQGFKSGVYNTIPPAPAPPVAPEEIDAYEVGFKASFAESSLNVNASFFYYDYSELQVSVFQGTVASIQNAAAADVYGFDFEFVWLATENLQFRGGFEVLDTEYTEYPGGQIATERPLAQGGGVITTVADLSGNELTLSPDFTGNVMVNYNMPLASGAEINFNTNLYYNDGYFYTVGNAHKQDSYALLNASVKYTLANGKTHITLWGKNVLDEEHYATLSTQADPGGSIRGSASAPGTFGINVGMDF